MNSFDKYLIDEEKEKKKSSFDKYFMETIPQVGLGISAKATGGISLPEAEPIVTAPLPGVTNRMRGIGIAPEKVTPEPEFDLDKINQFFQDPEMIEAHKANFESWRLWLKELKETKDKVAFLKGEGHSPELIEAQKKSDELLPYMYGEKGGKWLNAIAISLYSMGLVSEIIPLLSQLPANILNNLAYKVEGKTVRGKELLKTLQRVTYPDPRSGFGAPSEFDRKVFDQFVSEGVKSVHQRMVEGIKVTTTVPRFAFGTKLYAGLPADEIAKSIVAVGKVTAEMVKGLDPVKVSQVTQALLNTSPALASAFLKAVEKPEVIPPEPAKVTPPVEPKEELKAKPAELGKKYQGKAYRTETRIPEHGADIIGKMKTAQEKLNYDASTTGNPIFKEAGKLAEKLGIDLNKVPIGEMAWVARDFEIAEKYDGAEEYKLPEDTIILAKDDEGGFLILKNVDKYKKAEAIPEAVTEKPAVVEAPVEKKYKVYDQLGNYFYTNDKFKVGDKISGTTYVTKIEAPAPAKAEVKAEIELATPAQIKKAYDIADSKNMISDAGKIKPQYRAVAKAMTGKTSMEKMTSDEAETFINSLDSLVMRGKGLPPRIPTTKDIITQDFAEKIPKLNEIGIKEAVRPAWRVFKKIGLYKEVFEPAFEAEINTSEDLIKFNEDITKLRKTVGKGKEETKKLFNVIENPERYNKLSPQEKKAIDWGVKFFDDWADKLKLEPEKRREHYITHIFEKEIAESLKEKYPLDPNIVAALDFITPKTIFNPYLQERLGKKVGLKEDFFAALNAYEGRALKKFYYEPLIQRIRVYTKYLPPNSARYLREYITRITGRPLIIDREVNQSLKEAAEIIKKLPGGRKLATALTQGNASGMVAYNLAGIYYEAYMGFRPLSAIKNLSQHGLILSEVGPKAFTQALTYPNLKERNRLLSQSLVLRSRPIGYLPGIDESFIKQLDNKRRKATMLMFRLADKKNVSDAFLAGYFEAKNKGLPDEYAFKRGDEVAQKTQYLYTKLAGPQLTQSSVGRVMGVLTTWPENWAELMNDFVQGKPSDVYKEYEKISGKKITPTNWVLNRKSLWIYLGLVSLAMLIQRKTRLKALYYTGWTSLKAIADLASGQFAGLELPGLIAQLTAGIATGDMQQARTAARQLRPDRFIVITRELEDIANGKKDWMNLFVYLEKEKKEEIIKPAELESFKKYPTTKEKSSFDKYNPKTENSFSKYF